MDDGAFSTPGIDVMVIERNTARRDASTNVAMSAISGRALSFSASLFHPFLSVKLTVYGGAEFPPSLSTTGVKYW